MNDLIEKGYSQRFQFLRWGLESFDFCNSGTIKKLDEMPDHFGDNRYPMRLLRYWWAGQALAHEAGRRGRPLRVLDLGCERGWLKLFTPEGAVEHWLGLDWKPRTAEQIGYDEVTAANFDEPLPVATASVDAVASLHVFEHLPRPGFTLAEVCRVLSVGGVFLAGTPTMPEPFASLRERHHRRGFSEGRVAVGGHINSMSPSRWQRLLYEVGLSIDFLTGSHAIRCTGNRLEDSRAWIRLNQVWGGLFPSLGSECCLQARRGKATHPAAGVRQA